MKKVIVGATIVGLILLAALTGGLNFRDKDPNSQVSPSTDISIGDRAETARTKGFKTKARIRETEGVHATHRPDRLIEFMLPTIDIDGLSLNEALCRLKDVYEETCLKTGETPLSITFDIPQGSHGEIHIRLDGRDFSNSVKLLATLSAMNVKRLGSTYRFTPIVNGRGKVSIGLPVPPDLSSVLSELAGKGAADTSTSGAGSAPQESIGEMITALGLDLDPSTRLSLDTSGVLKLETNSTADAAVVSNLIQTLGSQQQLNSKFETHGHLHFARRDREAGPWRRGGTISQHQVKDTRYGTFTIELDASLLLHKQYEQLLATVGIDLATFKNKQILEDVLRDLAATVVPFEIITPPIPLSQLPDINPMVDALRKWKAKGTGSSPLYAFGLHLNPEVPELTAESLLRHLQAYTMLDAWIRKDAKVDLSRQLTPYINEFEPDYIRFILREHYQPDLQTLIRDYFAFGNSRNRPLDLLPVFMHLEPALTKSLQKDDLTSARPTFHYRLPNCSIEDPDWSLVHEWNRWSLVELLAEDTPALRKHAALYLSLDDNSLFSIKRKWVKLIDEWVRREA